MKITHEQDASDFLDDDSWCCDTMKEIMERHPDKTGALDSYFEEAYPDGIDKTALNDALRFDWKAICDSIGIEVDDDGNDIEDEEEEDEDEEDEDIDPYEFFDSPDSPVDTVGGI